MLGAALLLAAAAAAAPAAPQATARLEVKPETAKIGDPLAATITVTLPPGDDIDPTTPATTWGDAQVLSGRWAPAGPNGTTQIWKGTIAIYRVGSVTVPAVEIGIVSDGATSYVTTAPASVTIEPSLPAAAKAGKAPEIADLKPPAAVAPDYRPLEIALAALAALLALAGLCWWLWRRYAARMARAAVPPDPFRKLPPHVWVYEELRKLLERRLAEEGKIGLFYDELTRIVKMYLEGRYRVDLLERTTGEVPEALRQAGAPGDTPRLARAILETGDLVKFAKSAAGPAECRAAVDEAYRLVDLTKPREAPAAEAPAGVEP